MSDEEDQVENGEGEEDEVPEEEEPAPAPTPAPKAAPAAAPPAARDVASPPPAGREHGVKELKREPPPKTIAIQARNKYFGAGKPSKHDKTKLMSSEGIIRIQAGSNKHASQRGMTGKTIPAQFH